jgi:hypothetical protein
MGDGPESWPAWSLLTGCGTSLFPPPAAAHVVPSRTHHEPIQKDNSVKPVPRPIYPGRDRLDHERSLVGPSSRRSGATKTTMPKSEPIRRPMVTPLYNGDAGVSIPVRKTIWGSSLALGAGAVEFIPELGPVGSSWTGNPTGLVATRPFFQRACDQ